VVPALLVLDPQNDFFAADNPHLKRFHETVPVINSAIAHFRARSWPIFFIRHTSPAKPAGSEAGAVYAGFALEPDDVCLNKSHLNAFWETDLDAQLRARQVSFVLLAGFLAEFCVLSTFRGAQERGYQTALLPGGIASLADEPTQWVHAICRQMAPAELDEAFLAAGAEPVVRYVRQGSSPVPEAGQARGSQEPVAFLNMALSEAYAYLRRQVEGLTAEDFFWRPAAECWSLRRLEDGRWSLDYAEAPLVLAPVTTIAWRMVHVAACKLMYYEYAFGPASLIWDDLVLPGTPDAALTFLEEGQQQLLSALTELTAADLQALRPTNWGQQWPTWRIFWTMITHDLEHGAEIGLLRQLYRLSRETGI
jgi:nicotinamidase-related amidase